MIIEVVPYEIASEDFSEATEPRSPGLHLSQIIHELQEARGIKYSEEGGEQARQLRFSAGFMFERLLSNLFRETALKKSDGRLIRPGEVHRDGIAMSPDAIDIEDWCLEEYKLTWLGTQNPIDDKKFWHWIVQMKAYCYAIGTQRARLRVFFINGDWRGSGPQIRCWQFHFNERELEENWQMCLNHARARGWL